MEYICIQNTGTYKKGDTIDSLTFHNLSMEDVKHFVIKKTSSSHSSSYHTADNPIENFNPFFYEDTLPSESPTTLNVSGFDGGGDFGGGGADGGW